MLIRSGRAFSTLVAILWFTGFIEPAIAQKKAPDDEADQVYSYCFKPNASMAEGRICISDQEVRLKRQLDAAVRQKLFDISEVAKRTADDGPPNGKETADRVRAAFNKEQAAWKIYSNSMCQGLYDFGSGTAGSADDAVLCRIKSIFRRISDLRH